jgi:hypothetical protein
MYTTGAALFIWRHSIAILIEQHLDLGVDMTRFTSKLGEGCFGRLLFQMINPASAPQWEFEASGNLHWVPCVRAALLRAILDCLGGTGTGMHSTAWKMGMVFAACMNVATL